MAQAVGKVISAAVVGVMVHQLKPRTCIELVALLPFLVMCSSFVLQDERKPICRGAIPFHFLLSLVRVTSAMQDLTGDLTYRFQAGYLKLDVADCLSMTMQVGMAQAPVQSWWRSCGCHGMHVPISICCYQPSSSFFGRWAASSGASHLVTSAKYVPIHACLAL